jgi:hypothetical protein
MRYARDSHSSHDYEVKKLHFDDEVFDALVFYVREGEPVRVETEQVLKKTRLWVPPTESDPEKEYVLLFEVRPRDSLGTTEVYLSRISVKLNRDGRT